MSIKRINICELLDYKDREGIILKGCGGKLQDWLDGINDLFAEKNILLDGTEFKEEDVVVFDKTGLTCILFEFTDNVKLDVGKLAMWRIGTHATFGGTWLTDFVANELCDV